MPLGTLHLSSRCRIMCSLAPQGSSVVRAGESNILNFEVHDFMDFPVNSRSDPNQRLERAFEHLG